MKKGFTLVELLAVIAILAIILVIAYPLVTGVIEDARVDSLNASGKLIANAAELAYTTGDLSASTTYDCTSVTWVKLDASDPWGNTVDTCAVTLDANGAASTVSYGSTSSSTSLSSVDPSTL